MFEDNKIYENQSFKYLFPLLQAYGSTFVGFLNRIYKLGIFIGDINYPANPIGKNLHLVIKNYLNHSSKQSYEKLLSDFINYVRQQHFYEADYLLDTTKHVIVLKLPHDLTLCIDEFVRGKYSKMFTEKQIKEYFSGKHFVETRKVLTHDMSYAQTYLDKVNKDYMTDLQLEDILNHEWDYPPQLEKEVLNFKK